MKLFIYTLAFLMISIITIGHAEESASPDNFPWSFSYNENGGEKTKRVYLLVTNSVQGLGQVQVESDCEKAGPGEARFGQCKHHLHFLPSGKTVVLDQGETVLEIRSAFGDIATVNYGCCASPNVITFYDYNMQPLGTLTTHDPIEEEGRFTVSYMGNLSSGKMYLDGLILDKDKDGHIKKYPVDNEFIGPESKCEGWDFKRFSFGDRLTLIGDECGEVWSGPCKVNGDRYKCTLTQKSNPDSAP